MVGKGYILVVEADEQIRQLLEYWLTEAGHVVHAVPTRSATAPPIKPDLVILDVPRPEDIPSQMRALDLDARLSVLVISARFRRGVETSSEIASRLGVRKVLSKPFTQEELLAAVRSVISPHG